MLAVLHSKERSRLFLLNCSCFQAFMELGYETINDEVTNCHATLAGAYEELRQMRRLDYRCPV